MSSSASRPASHRCSKLSVPRAIGGVSLAVVGEVRPRDVVRISSLYETYHLDDRVGAGRVL